MDVAKIIIPSVLFSLQVNMCLHKLGFWYLIHETSDEPISETDTQILIEKWDMEGTEKKTVFLHPVSQWIRRSTSKWWFFFFLLIKKIPKNSNWSIKCFLIFFYFMKRTRKILIKRLFQSFPKTGRFSKIKVSQVLTSLMHYTKK